MARKHKDPEKNVSISFSVGEMIELIQTENISYSSNVPGLTLKVSMPPPDYFNQVNRDEYNVNEVLLVD